MSRLQAKIPVGILGATGTVGQQLVLLLSNHPWFELVCVAASENSAGKTYAEAVAGRWSPAVAIPESVQELTVLSVVNDKTIISDRCRLVFSAIEADKQIIQELEETYASLGLAVVSNNSAHRWTKDVPMLIPEINWQHLDIIPQQRQNRGWTTGLIVTKPNCSLQSYVPILHAWKVFQPVRVIVSTYQAVSGAGKTLTSWPEMVDNVIPFIVGEELKSETEPQKIWATISNGRFCLDESIKISANCVRVPVSHGHMAVLNIEFATKPSFSDLVWQLENFQNPLVDLNLPSAPAKFLTYFAEENRPQTRLDRDLFQGMGISVGRLRQDSVLDWKCVGLSHNTLRGAAGGSMLNAELLVAKGFLSY